MHKKLSRGFTLIELMVVIGIMGVLVAVSATSFISAQLKARDARRKSDLSQISKALEMYYNDQGRYPLASNGQIAGCGSGVCGWGDPEDSLSNVNQSVVYLEVIPADPTNGHAYRYRASGDGLSYQLYARLENENDPDLDRNGDGSADNYSGISCGSNPCNFALTSPNTRGGESL